MGDDEDVLALVRASMTRVKSPSAYDKVYKVRAPPLAFDLRSPSRRSRRAVAPPRDSPQIPPSPPPPRSSIAAFAQDECVYSFDTPFSPGGLYVNLTTHLGVGADFLALDHRKTGAALYLHQRWTRTRKPASEETRDANHPTRMAIGVEGGFNVDDDADYDITKTNALVVMPSGRTLAVPNEAIPVAVSDAIAGVLRHAGFHESEEIAAWSEERKESKYARDLRQEPCDDPSKKISPDPSTWRCAESGATENLWLNLGSGHVGSGRAHWDGSGGNGAALRHYEAMRAEGKHYPLVVKLGTITPTGADVYSYAPDEDDMVEDPLLAEHLSHWGVDVMKMSKTEKSMAELQIDLNKGFEFDKITEAGADLEPVRGARAVGLKNLGNTCYVNSLAQCLKEIPALEQKYAARRDAIFESAPADPTQDFPTQIAKLLDALVGEKYARAEPVEGGPTDRGDVDPDQKFSTSVAPRMFKQLVGKGHAEFATGRQQDAVEYFQHLLETANRAERKHAARLGGADEPSTASTFEFEMEERVACDGSGQVKYLTRRENVLPLEVPVDRAVNVAEVAAFEEREKKRQRTAAAADSSSSAEEESPVRPIVPFEACVARLAADEKVEDWHSPALGRKGVATRRARLATMPPVLAVQVRRYYVASDWTPKKLDALVPMPETMSLEHLRAKGAQPDETIMAEEEADAAKKSEAAAPPEADEAIVAQVMSMGFSENGSRRAAIAVNNASAEHAVEWVFAHMEDADFNDPPSAAAATTTNGAAGSNAGSNAAADASSTAMLSAMGFSDAHARTALHACGGDVERAADWLFSRADDLDAACAAFEAERGGSGGDGGGSAGAEGSNDSKCLDGPGEYELFGVVSHMGGNTACGHYVAHVKQDGRWLIFNDRKVAVSANPPLDLGYLYFYRRKA